MCFFNEFIVFFFYNTGSNYPGQYMPLDIHLFNALINNSGAKLYK